MTYRATVWYLSAMAGVVDGDSAITRRVLTHSADSPSHFTAIVRDMLTRDVDDEVWFGPISEVRS